MDIWKYRSQKQGIGKRQPNSQAGIDPVTHNTGINFVESGSMQKFTDLSGIFIISLS